MRVQEIDGKMAWYIVIGYIRETGLFLGLRGNKYPCRCSDDVIYYKGENRNNSEEEEIRKEDFIMGFDTIKSLEKINSNSIKGLIPNKLYRKRTALIGLMLSAEIIK